MEAYIFINSEPRMVWHIAEEARKIEGVKMAHAVTGQFDVAMLKSYGGQHNFIR